MPFEVGTSDSPISERMRESARDRKEEVGEIKEARAEGKAGLGGAVVINLIRERKGPGAYIVINPHNGRIIFISQFSTLYTLSSSAPHSQLLCFCVLLCYAVLISCFGGDSCTLRRPFVMPSAVCYCITHLHITAPFCITFTFYKLQKRLLQMNACLSVQGCLCAGVLESGWVSSGTFTDQL